MTVALLLSGGMDSTAIAWWKRPEFGVTIDYGQVCAVAEIRAAKAVCEAIGMEHFVLHADLSSLGSGDLAGRPQLPDAPVREWWPFRNQMLITLAAMLTIPCHVNRLLIGCLSTDATHADGSENFVAAIDHLLSLQEGAIRVEAPAIKMTAVELLKTAKVPIGVLAWAHSCHVSNHACGLCRGCQKHYETLEALGHEPY